MTIFSGLPGVCPPSSTFWSVFLQPVGEDQATIWQIKGDIPSFHLRHGGLLSVHRLQSWRGHKTLNIFSLVKSFFDFMVTHLPGKNLLLRQFWQLLRSCSYLVPSRMAELPKSKSMGIFTDKRPHSWYGYISHPSHVSLSVCILLLLNTKLCVLFIHILVWIWNWDFFYMERE